MKMANLPVPSVCETVTDRQTDRLSRLPSVCDDAKMAHLTGQNGLSDVTGKRLLKHDWTDWTAKMVHHCVTEIKRETRNKVKKCFITKIYVLLGQ